MNLSFKSLFARWTFILVFACPLFVMIGCGEGDVPIEQTEAEDAQDEASEAEDEANEDDGDGGGRRRRRGGDDEDEDEDE